MKILSLYLWMTFLTISAVSAQNNTAATVDNFAGEFITSIRNRNTEKIILQTDRNVYIAGEKIWFKAFLLHALSNRVDTASKNLFIDLVDDNDAVIKQQVLNASHLFTSGAIQLNDSMPTGYYWLRSYTQHILQADSDAICTQLVYIKNISYAENNLPLKPTKKFITSRVIVHFYAEGGTMVTGTISSGVLQVSAGDGNPLQAQGVIKDERDSLITSFVTNKLGLAKISYYPAWFKKYFAVMQVNGKEVRYPLDAYNPFAARLSVTGQTGGTIQASVALEDSLYSSRFTTYILALNRDSICFAGVGQGMYNINIPVTDFPGGTAVLLLFDAKGTVLSEREIFINKDNYNIDITPAKLKYGARDNVQLAINIKDAAGKPLVASLSVSVQDSRLMVLSDNINADALLPPSDAGKTDDWLMQHKSLFSAADIDMMMMAKPPAFHNWRLNMRQDDIRADDTELLMNLEGKVVNRRQQPLPEKVVTAISVTGRDPYLALDTTDGTGNFKLPLPIYRDSLVLKIEVKNKHDRNEDDNIQVNYFKFPQFSTPVALKRHYFQQQESFVKNLNRYHTDTVFAGIGKEWLTPVIVKTYVKPKALTGYDESKRVNSFSFILNQEKLKQYGAGSIGNALLMIPGISYKQGQLAMYGGDGWMDSTHLSEPLLVLDGVRMPKNMLGAGDTASTLHESPTMAFLNAFTYQDIDFIEVLRGPEASIYGADGGDGVILVNTKTHQADESLAGAYKIIKPVTYNLPPKFVMPDYFLKQVKNSKAPDPRTTIYWNANVVTGADGIASVNFFTADDATTYTVTITGLTANGDFVYKRITLNRK